MADPGPRAPRLLRSSPPSGATSGGVLGPLSIIVVVVAALYFGREVFVPLALAILLSFVLGPVVLKLRRLHLGRIPAVLVTVLLAFVVIFALGAMIGQPGHRAGREPLAVPVQHQREDRTRFAA